MFPGFVKTFLTILLHKKAKNSDYSPVLCERLVAYFVPVLYSFNLLPQN